MAFELYILRRFGPLTPLLIGLGLVLILVFKHSAVGMAVIWIGCGVFCFTNYAAARRHELWFIGPGASAFGTLGCFLLAVTSLIAGIAGNS